MRIASLFFLAGLLISSLAYGQRKGKYYQAEVVDGDTIASVTLKPVPIIDAKNLDWFFSERNKLFKNVKKVMPYAMICAERVRKIDYALDTIENRRQRKLYVKSAQKELTEEFEKELKKLTWSQGELLVKLINRETGRTVHSLIKDYRKGVNAFIWQGTAKIFGMDLKEDYNPEKEEEIEAILAYLGYE